MYGLTYFMKVPFEITHKISYHYIKRYDYNILLKIYNL